VSVKRGYPSDLTDEQWAVIKAPVPPVRAGGRPEKHPRRAIVNAVFCVVRTGWSWRQLPHEFPPWPAVFWYFRQWRADGTTDRLPDALRDRVRDSAGRDPMASAGTVDAQSVKGADTVRAGSRGFDAGKKVNGPKRHIVVDTMGLLLAVIITTGPVCGGIGRSWVSGTRLRIGGQEVRSGRMPVHRPAARCDDATVGKQFATVVEQHYPIAEQAPPLLGMCGHHMCGLAVEGIGWWARGLVLAHFGPLVRTRCRSCHWILGS
jgi:transposase